MNRRLLMWALPLAAAVSLSVVAWRQFSGKPQSTEAQAAELSRWWSSLDKPAEPEHELKALQASLKQKPGHAPILLRMAQVSRDLGRTGESIGYLREAVKGDPENREARLELGRALFNTGDVQGAIRETEALLEIDPANPDALYNLGAIYGNLGQDDSARKYWRKAVAISPDSESGRRAKDGLRQIGDAATP